jgi:hypothetical protein
MAFAQPFVCRASRCGDPNYNCCSTGKPCTVSGYYCAKDHKCRAAKPSPGPPPAPAKKTSMLLIVGGVAGGLAVLLLIFMAIR